MQMLSGAPEIILFTWLPRAALWLRGIGRRRVALWPGLRRLAVVVALVAWPAAGVQLPFGDLVSIRTGTPRMARRMCPCRPGLRTSSCSPSNRCWTLTTWPISMPIKSWLCRRGRVGPGARWRLARAPLAAGPLAGGRGVAAGAGRRASDLLPQGKRCRSLAFARYPVKFTAPRSARPGGVRTVGLVDALAPAGLAKPAPPAGYRVFFNLAAGRAGGRAPVAAPGENWAADMPGRRGADAVSAVTGGVGGLLAAGQTRTRTLLGAAVVVLIGLTRGSRLANASDGASRVVLGRSN